MAPRRPAARRCFSCAGEGLGLPGVRSRALRRAEGPRGLPVQSLQATVGLTAGTVFRLDEVPLTSWFLAIYHLSHSKGGMSSVELARRLGTMQPTAWLIKHKLITAMAAREAEKPNSPAGWRSTTPISVAPGPAEGGRGAAGIAVRGGRADHRRAQTAAAAAYPSEASANIISRNSPATSPPAAT